MKKEYSKPTAIVFEIDTPRILSNSATPQTFSFDYDDEINDPDEIK